MAAQSIQRPRKKIEKTKPKRKLITPKKSKAIVALREAGMTLQEIGDNFGLCKAGVWQHLKKITPENKEFHNLKENLSDQFAKASLDNLNLSAKLTKHLTNLPDELLGKINPVNLAAIKRTADVALGIAHDHFRLESGQSTVNQMSLHADIMELRSGGFPGNGGPKQGGSPVDNSA